MKNSQEIFAIISAARPDKSPERIEQDTQQIEGLAKLNGYQTRRVTGVWNDTKEISVIISGSPNKIGHFLADFVSSMVSAFHQEAGLLVDGHECVLIDSFGNITARWPFEGKKPVDVTDTVYSIETDGTKWKV